VVELGPVRLGVALEEEVERLVSRDPVAVERLDGRRPPVAGAQHAARAQDFDPLVVAVGGAPAVADLAQGAARRPEGGDRGVDIADLADRRVDQAARAREHFDRLLAKQPARHVEVVDHHVAKQASGYFEIRDGRQSRIAARDCDHLDGADAARAHGVVESAKARVEAPVEADQEIDAGALDLAQAGVDATDIEVDGFLAKDRLARLGGGNHEVGMGIGGAGDHHRVDRLIGECGLAVHGLGAVVCRQRRRRVGVDVDDASQARLRVAGDVGGVDCADAAGAELADVDHGFVAIGCSARDGADSSGKLFLDLAVKRNFDLATVWRPNQPGRTRRPISWPCILQTTAPGSVPG
jgi:hypothetical protein